jgi:MYXO-CTERM domain-containing protein
MTGNRRLLGFGLAGITLAGLTLSSPADAHWCNDLWISRYNVSVRPATDTVTVPTGGQATLDIFVRNDMGYPLTTFSITATAGGCTITNALKSTLTKTGYLLPGETATYTLTIKGCATLAASSLNIAAKFDGQTYSATVIENAAGQPGALTNVGSSNEQAWQLGGAASADWGTTATGLDFLMGKFCAGRGSWDSGGGGVSAAACTGTATACPASTATLGTGGGSKFDYPKLWSAGELAIRKSALGARLATLRDRLKCAMGDPYIAMSGFEMIVLGYLGEDAGARTALEAAVTAGGDKGTVAKAALLLMGSAADKTKYQADVTTCAASTNVYLSSACAAALGIVNKDDAIVKSVLIKNANWQEPDTGANGAYGIYSSYLLEIVAWDRLGWAPKGAAAGTVSFYSAGGAGAAGAAGAPGVGGAAGAPGAGGAGGATPGAGGATPGAGGATPGAGGAVPGAGGATPGAGGATPGAGGAVPGAGGATPGAGGTAPGAGGAAGSTGAAGGAQAAPTENAGGCSCSTVGGGFGNGAASLLLAGLAGLVIRRRRRA